EVSKVVVVQGEVTDLLLAAMAVNGHVLLEGVPGVAKTLLVKTLATALDLQFTRVQFTPDLMPADLTGQLVLDPSGGLRFRPGPVFTNLLLADEINRTPPKTQSALLEAMEERQVSIDGQARLLPEPFLVVATQNPIEYEGTYPLPEAQLDRFLFKLSVDYPNEAEEYELLRRHHHGLDPRHPAAAGVRPVLSPERLAAARREVAGVVVEPVVLQYVVALSRATRAAPSTQLGASPRAMVALLAAAKAWAWLAGRSYVTPDEVKVVYKPALRHRVSVRPELAVEGVTTDTVLDRILASVPAPR
ncbi:MAG: MoxR family ATPase, partial [Acidimicrobiales bacterium]|nr:MoxR family ATPase [Acidimicrobiales bacterium]